MVRLLTKFSIGILTATASLKRRREIGFDSFGVSCGRVCELLCSEGDAGVLRFSIGSRWAGGRVCALRQYRRRALKRLGLG
jgi:hypothetical protein